MPRLETVREAREHVQKHRRKGVVCPTCDRYTKIYPRSLSANMIRGLTMIYKLTREKRPPGRWFHHTTLSAAGITASFEYSKLTAWGLMESHPERKGYWRCTPLAQKFIRRKVVIQKTALFDKGGVCVGAEGPHVSIGDCLGTKFSLRELLAT